MYKNFGNDVIMCFIISFLILSRISLNISFDAQNFFYENPFVDFSPFYDSLLFRKKKSFDLYINRTESSTQRKILHSLTIVYLLIGFTIRLFIIIVESFTEFPKYNREWMDIIESDIFGFTFHRQLNKQMSINIDNNLNYKTIYAEIGIEIFLLLLTYCAEKNLNEKDNDNPNDSRITDEIDETLKANLSIDSEAKVEFFYEAYQDFKIEKTFFKCLFFISLICIVSTNISISNTINLIILLILILVCLLQPSQNNYLVFLSQVFCLISFLLLISQYVMNIKTIKNKKINAYLGIIEFENNLGNFHFISLVAGYFVSCFLNKYDYEMNEYKEKCRSFLLSINVEFKPLKERKYFFMTKLFKLISDLLFYLSSFFYKLMSLLWILFHVSIIMFINFIIISLGYLKNKGNFRKYYLLPSFFVNLVFLFVQYIYNLNGFFIFEKDNNIYKIMEIIGFYKYFKWKIQEYSKQNLADIYLTTDAKFQGLLTDMLVIVMLFIFAFFIIKKNEKKELKRKKLEIRPLTEEEKDVIHNEHQETKDINKEQSESFVNFMMIYIIEKSFILSLLILFSCSITKFDVIHLIYFFLFFLLVSFNEKHFKKIWYVSLLTNQLIIIFLYFWNIFAVNYFNLEEEVNPAKKNIFSYLGLKIDNKQIFFVSYWEHIILALWGLFQHFLFSSKYMKRKRDTIHNMTDNSVISEEEECIRNLYRFPDSLKYVFFIITYLSLLLLSLIRPLSFQGLIFFFLMMLIVFVQLFLIKEEKSKFLNFLIGLVTFIAIVILSFKYLINFPFFMDYIKEVFNLNNNFILKNAINRVEGLSDASHNMLFKKDPKKIYNLDDFGMDQENLTYKLIFNCFLIILLKVLISYDEFPEKNDGNKLNSERNQKSENQMETAERVFIYFKVIFFQIVYLHSTKILILVSAIIALNLGTMIGGLILIIVLICLIEGKNNNWKYAFFPLFFFCMITLNFIYLCNLKLFRKWMTKDYEWLGIYNPNSTEELLSHVFPFLVIMILSYFARISQKYKDFYRDKSSLLETESSISEVNQTANDISTGNLISNEADKLNFNLTQVSVREEVNVEDSIIETISDIWYTFDYIWYLYGFYIILFVILMISFIKVNLLSIIYLAFIGLQSFNVYFRTDYITEHEKNNVNFKNIKRNWNLFSLFILFCTLIQYLNLLWFPPSWKIAKPWESFSFFCSKEGKRIFSQNIHYKNISDYEYCTNNWKAWLNIDNIEPKDIFNNFMCAFLIMLCQKYLTSQDIFKRPEFDITKVKDFTIAENRETRDLIHYILFIYLKKIILIYIIFISLVYSYISTNIIYGGFLFFSFFLLFKEGKLDKEKNKLWKFVQYYNFIVLVAIMLFQTPFLPCPVNRDERSYIGLEECVEEEYKIYKNNGHYNYPKHKVDAIYMLMVQIFGIQKLDFYFLVVGNLSLFLIYIVAVVQQIIFDHPFQIIVDSYNIREKQINCKSRAFKIVQDIHLTTNMEYRRVNTLNNILQEKLIRLDRKISEYGNLSQNSKLVTRIEDENDELEELNPVNKIREDIDIFVETLISNDLNIAGLIKFQEVKKKVNEIFNKLNTKYHIEPNNYYKIEKKFKEEFLKDLLDDIKKFQLMQLIQDKRKIYENDFTGLNIASEAFQEITELENNLDKDVDLDMELLKKLFLTESLHRQISFYHDEVKEERAEEVKEDVKKETNEEKRENENVNQIIKEKQSNTNVISESDKKIDEPELVKLTKNIFNNIVEFLKQFFYKWIDKTLLIDLVINHKQKISGFFDIMIYSFYSNIEMFLLFAFILNHINDASILSSIYPLTYFGYGLIEYPFPSKGYWRLLIMYGLFVISIKLIYQFPLFCGYPFHSIFNIFNDNVCEIYNLSDQEIFEEFNYTLGLRKYTGPYSYPKNQGIISGIMWDVIILVLLLIQRSLQKAKGIWNFISIKNEYLKTPMFDHKNASINNIQINNQQNNPPVAEQIDPVNREINSPSQEDNIKTIFSNFLKRLIPEIYLDKKFPVYKPGYDYYPLSFCVLLAIVVYTLFSFGKMTGKTGQTLKEALDRQQFSTDLIGGILLIVIVILVDRVIYKLRSVNDDFIKEMFPDDQYNTFEENTGSEAILKNEEHIRLSNIALICKIVLHYSLLIFVHYELFFVLPYNNHIYFSSNTQLIYFYFFCCIYFYLSSSQLKYGFPLVTKGQYFADSTALFSRIMFKIYRNMPFLFELRAIFDWTITKTSLDLYQWFKMEDAYANLYDVRADMDLRKARFRGEERGLLEKIQWGLLLFIFLMGCLFLPMLLFSTFNPSLIENKVLGGQFSINYVIKNNHNNLTTYSLNLFETKNMKINDIKDSREYEYLKKTLISHADDVDERKIQKIQIVNYSQQDWIISPPTIFSLIEHLEKKDKDSYIVFRWEFRRHFPLNNKVIAGSYYLKLKNEQINAFKNIMYALRNGDKNLNKYNFDLSSAFPRIIRLSNRNYKYIRFDTKQKSPYKDNTDIRMNLIKENDRDIYWLVNQKNVKEIEFSPFYNKNEELEFILISDDVISSFFGFNTDSGSVPLNIVGIYVTIVYAIGRFIRIFFDKISMKVIYEELPEPMEIFELCEGIFIYRIQRKLDKENSLYDLLIRIYRSPEVLIRITGQRVKYLRNDEEKKNQDANITVNR